MAMSTHTATGQEIVEMNTTPLIDVMLVLLVLLIVTLPIQTHAVKLNMPSGDPPQLVPPDVVELGVDFDGGISWNGSHISRGHAGCLSCGCGAEEPAAGDTRQSRPAVQL